MARKSTTTKKGSEKKAAAPNEKAPDRMIVQGVKNTHAVTGKIDMTKQRLARKAVGTAGGLRQGGMLIDTLTVPEHAIFTGMRSQTYRTSYSNGLNQGAGSYDVPTYFITMNEMNGGIIYWPVTIREKYNFYRYFARTDAYVARGLSLLADLPMSRFTINMPSMDDKEKRSEIKRFFENQMEVLDIFNLCRDILLERNMLGNCFPAGHLVQTPEGHIPIEEVKVGTMVLTDQGRFRPALAVASRNFKGNLIHASMAGSSALDISPTPEHPVFILRGDEEKMVEAGQIQPGDRVGIGFVTDVEEYGDIPGTGSYVNGDFCRMIGHWVNGGYFAKVEFSDGSEGITPAFFPGAMEAEYDDAVISYLGKSLGLTLRDISDSDGVYVDNPEFSRWFVSNFRGESRHSLGMPVIPLWFKKLPVEMQERFISGIFNSKGFIADTADSAVAGIEIDKDTGEDIAHDVFEISLRCGIPFEFADVDTHVLAMTERDGAQRLADIGCRNVDVNLFTEEGDMMSPWSPRHLIFANGKAWQLVSNISRVQFNGTVYNFEVDEDHTYCSNHVRTHNCYIFHEWDDDELMWSRASMLPPEEVSVFAYPFTSEKRIEYKPEAIIRMIQSYGPYSADEFNEVEAKIVKGIPKEVVDMVHKEGCIVMDNDPMKGSFCHHIARNRSPYMDLGISILEGCYVPLLQREHFKYTQLSLATRNMTPKNLITAPGVLAEELDELREQIDQSYLDPDYTVLTNYDADWRQIGTSERLLDLSREYETIENHIFAALGIPREVMTGEGMYSGSKISIEILNTILMQERDVIKDYVEKVLFRPICDAHGWFEVDGNGIKTYWCPIISFNRMTIRDNAEIFDNLFMLYQKGSIPIEVIYELLNLNPEEIGEKLKSDVLTVNDPNFNELIRGASMDIGRDIAENSDITKRVADYLGLNYSKPDEGDGDMGGDGMPGMDGGMPGMGGEEIPGMEGMEALAGNGAPVEPELGEESFMDALAGAGGEQPPMPEESAPDAIGEVLEQQPPAEASPGLLDEVAQAVVESIPVPVDDEDVKQIVQKALE